MELYEASDEEPPCERCHVELWPENRRVWRLFSLCRNQVLRAGMDGTVVGVNHTAVLGDIALYVKPEEVKDVFEEILICFNTVQEVENK